MAVDITLKPMDARNFALFRPVAIESFARETAKAEGTPLLACREIAVRAFDDLLPHGPGTENHFLFDVVPLPGKERVGWVWFWLRASSAGSSVYVYDITIDDAHQGKGYGEAAMRALEIEARRLGATVVKLHVFEHNDRARTLYEKLDYRVTGRMMTKPV